MWRTGPEPENCTAPVAPPSSSTRPAPLVPSKQINANTLPDTNLRASSAFIICPAKAGAITALAVTAPNTKREGILQLRLTEPGQPPYPSLPAPYHTTHANIE